MARERMARQDRFDQLVAIAWSIVRDHGADDLTLGRLATAAGITKPVVYSHFPSRDALLVALFEEYDERQNAALAAAVTRAGSSVRGRARAIAASFVDCVVTQGRELVGVAAALEGTPELAQFKRRSDLAYAEQLTTVLGGARNGATLTPAALTGMLGAAEALAAAAASGDMDRDTVVDELAAVIETTVARCRRAARSGPGSSVADTMV
ncbi:TetR/AcrR family transcriptional regulator [uncultured Williamsia sp.]|uniref:TetR/AcrR family transcriptional regulator n=1 Tax=uncultured Williamsia sp. TaxID=259311 RepID=UPI00262FFB8F|nr:TetR/AcrR family transcriptional regulator [uncultured Williamsia sp.]